MEIPFRLRGLAKHVHGIQIEWVLISARHSVFLCQRECHAEIQLAERLDLFLSAGFLPAEII